MNKKKIISIKNPRLRRIRNSLREIIALEAFKREREIMKEKDALLYDEEGKLKSELPVTELSKLSDEYWNIERALRASIIKCGVCHILDRDMVFVPKFKEWFCIECAKLHS